jgi:tetratricopeptide (TPR) repeat protein
MSGTTAADSPLIATRTDGAARMRVLRDLPDLIELGVDEGRVGFEINLAAGKDVRVIAGDVIIDVQSSSFAVERSERGVGVWVHEGWVSVLRDDTTILASGDHVWLANRAPEPPPSDGLAQRTGPGREDDSHAVREVLVDDEPDVADQVGVLMLAADAARRSGDPAAAVAPLERVTRDFQSDPRAPLAAYSLGRVLLHQMEQPSEAAAAFETARRLGLEPSLAEDALAREIEAWSRAGDHAKASDLARLYLREYPTGRWAHVARKAGAIE